MSGRYAPDAAALITTIGCREGRGLPLLHKDPFDRILVAQALVEPMILLTNDEVLSFAPGWLPLAPPLFHHGTSQ
ncbi:MAG: hypothetical protein JWN43_3980 [Gammaproteobacteria bacterium]|nr:hypothetical protein [Gammaproteobacteria bacterium]